MFGSRFILTAMAVMFVCAPFSRAQKPASAKDLVAQAEMDEKNNRWEAAREKLKLAADQKPKDKKIADMLLAAETFLANAAAEEAIKLCEQLEIVKCEKEAQRAKTFANTPRVQEAVARAAAKKKEIMDRWDRVQQMMKDGSLDEATSQLEALGRFSYMLPNLSAEKARLHTLRIEAALEQGRKELTSEKWDAAVDAFAAAMRLDPGNSQASRGIESAKQEKEAALAFQQAQNAYQAKSYQIAWEANEKALKLFPARKKLQDLGKQIGLDWSKVLMEEAHSQSSNPDHQKDNQKAMDNLELVRRMDPRTPGLAEEIRTVRLTLHSIYIQKAAQYEAVADNSRIGIAYAYYLNAQQTNPAPEFPFAAKMREVKSIFDRKRAVQILVNVDNLSSSASSIADLVSVRLKSVIRKLGLPDLKLRTLEEYGKSREEDPQFMENRPDGKSPTAQFTVELNNFESESTGNDKATEKHSKYISGQEMVPNPLYQQVLAEYNKVKQSLATVKPGKRSNEGYTQQDLTIKQQELTATPREIAREKQSDYTYQEFQLTVRALVKMNLEIRDMLEKQLIASETIEVPDKKTAVEISGVRDRDVNNLINRPARLPSADQLLQDCQRNALLQLDDKAQQLLNQYVQRFYSEGEKALRENRTEDAIENFLCHWYFFRGKLPEDKSQQIRSLVKREIGLDLIPGAA